MMQVVTRVVLLVVSVGTVMSQVPSWGGCPKVNTQDKVDLQQYLGTWYQIEAFPNYFQKGKCARAHYTLKSDGHIKVNNTEEVSGETKEAIGDAYRPDDKEQGKLKVRFSDFMPYGDYWVIDTDYTSYSLVYSCTEIASLFKLTYAWILARENTLSANTTAMLESELASYKVDIKPFKKDDRSQCPN